MNEVQTKTKTDRSLQLNSRQELDAADTNTLNFQATLDFTLIGTKLKAAVSKVGDKTKFLVVPADQQKTEGMTIKEMIDEVNKMMKGQDSTAQGIDSSTITTGIQNTVEASKTKGATDTNETPDQAISPDTIKVSLKQAFLLFSSGDPVEYALQLTLDASQVFPTGQSFFNVETLSFSIWNTHRAKILSRMDIINVDTYLEENA